MSPERSAADGLRQPSPQRVATPMEVQPPATLRVSSAQLFAGAAEIQIDHHGAVYRLKHTSSGKLILTK